MKQERYMEKQFKYVTDETDNVSSALEALCKIIARLADKDDRTETAVAGLSFFLEKRADPAK
jgi:hypothetical protein